ncbi:hypothetical protein EV13_1815 [Prochlorococcus sp. MIT 0702]|nr:hypothetical protein EV13_1815 [Prochlorococcus sp. MIT 0702]
MTFAYLVTIDDVLMEKTTSRRSLSRRTLFINALCSDLAS